ncbi:MAG: hypothetical protein LBV26_08875 [Bacteroidales bacterium]|nr:hypothetical protein [Bacteroidales bacterium]
MPYRFAILSLLAATFFSASVLAQSGGDAIFAGGDSEETWMGCTPDFVYLGGGDQPVTGMYSGGSSVVVILDCAVPEQLIENTPSPFTGGAGTGVAVTCGMPTVLNPAGEEPAGLFKGGPSNDFFVDCLAKPSIIDVNLPMFQGGRSYLEILDCNQQLLGEATLFAGGASRSVAVMCNEILIAGGGSFFGGSSSLMLTETACVIIEETLTGASIYGGDDSRGLIEACANPVMLGDEPMGGYFRGGNSAGLTAVDCYVPPCLDLEPAVITPLGVVPVCVGKNIVLEASPAAHWLWQRMSTPGNWEDISTGGQISIDSDAAGDYRLISFGSAAGCIDTSETFTAYFIDEIPKPVVTIDGSGLICQGGSIALHSTAAHAYLWSNGATTQTVWVTEGGEYTVTITDANGCEATSNPVTMTESPFPAPAATITPAGTTELCMGESQTLTANSGMAAYLWSNGETTQSITVSAAGKYTVRITDINGCEATADTVEIAVNDIRPVISHPEGLMIICYGTPVTLSLAPHTGAIPEDIRWYRDGSATPFATGNRILVTEVGFYSATLDTLNCTFNAPQVEVISNNATIPPASITPAHPVLCAGGTVMLTAGEAINYRWSTGEDTRTITVSAAGTYTVTVEDEFGCPSSASFVLNEVEVTIKPEIEAVTGQLALCPGASVTLRASEGVAFEWSNGATTQEITVGYADADSYTVTAYDANGCAVTSAPAEVLAVAEITPEVNAGIAVICGSSPLNLSVSPVDDTYTYEWSTGETADFIDVVVPGAYSVTIITAEGCRFTSAPVTVTQAPEPAIPVITSNFSIIDNTITVCSEQLDEVELASSEAASYLWSTGEETRSIFVAGAGKYAITVEYANGCAATSDTVTIVTVDVSISIETAGNQTQLCPGGSIAMTVDGADPGSLYEWFRNGESIYGAYSASYTATEPGSYHAVAVTPDGCTGIAYPVEITGYPTTPPVISSGGSLDICPNVPLYLTVTQGVTYQWTRITGTHNEYVDNTQSIYADREGVYVVAVTDRFGCVQEASVEVTEKPQYYPVIDAPRDTICQGDIMELSVQAPEGSTYLWSTGETTPAIKFDNPAIWGKMVYRVEVTYPEGCTFTTLDSVMVNMAPRQPEITVVGSNSICPDRSVALIATKNDGYNYQWRIETAPGVWENYHDGGQSSGIVVNENGRYQVTVTDKLTGCSSTSEILNLETLSSGTIDIFPAGPISLCETGGFVRLEAMRDDVLYEWSTGEKTKSITVTQTGVYSVTAIQILPGAECRVKSKPVVVRPGSLIPPPGITANGPTDFCEGGTVTLSTNSFPPNGLYTWYRWTPTDTTLVGNWRTVDVNESGEYVLAFDDINGCRVHSNVISVTVRPLPEAVVSPFGILTVCENTTITLSANEGPGYSYQWSAPGNPTTRNIEAGVGVYTVKVTTPQGCFAVSNPVEVRESAVQAPAPSASGAAVCPGTTALLTATSTIDNAEFLWWDAATGGNQTGAGDVYETPALAGNLTVWVSVHSELMCESPRSAVVATVIDEEQADIATPDNMQLCVAGAPVALDATPAGGVFSGAGVTGNSFDPALAGAGTHLIYYTITTPSGCLSTDSIQADVQPVPQAVFNNAPAAAVCYSELPITLDVTPAGGTLTGAGVTGMVFDPSAAGTGSHWIVYTVTAGACTAKDSVMITVVQPLFTVTAPSPLMAGDVVDLRTWVASADPTLAYTFFSNATGTVITAPGTATIPTGETVWYVMATDANGCQSEKKEIRITSGLQKTGPIYRVPNNW